MLARDVMSTPVITVRADMPVRAAAALLSEHAIASAPVVDADERVIGMVSELDLIRDRMPHDPRSHLRPAEPEEGSPPRLVSGVMTDTAVCLTPTADIADIAALMQDSRIRAVPIVEGARVVGIVSRRDLVRTLLRDDGAVAVEVLQRLRDFDPHRDWRVEVQDGTVTIGVGSEPGEGPGRPGGDREQSTITGLVTSVPGAVRVHLHLGAAR